MGLGRNKMEIKMIRQVSQVRHTTYTQFTHREIYGNCVENLPNQPKIPLFPMEKWCKIINSRKSRKK